MSYTREPWQDWTKEQWIEHQPASEQVRLRVIPDEESTREFLDWRGKKSHELAMQRDKTNPPEDRPTYGNAPMSGVIISGTTVGGPPPYRAGLPNVGGGPSGRGGFGGPGGFGHGGPGGPH